MLVNATLTMLCLCTLMTYILKKETKIFWVGKERYQGADVNNLVSQLNFLLVIIFLFLCYFNRMKIAQVTINMTVILKIPDFIYSSQTLISI